ncbi:MAG: 30S ribosomal protein S4 [bacterium]
MSATNDKQCKLCRRAGKKLMLKGDRCNSPKCAMVSRNYPPGIHGNKRRARKSQYGTQLTEKQKAKQMYGLREKQFKNLFDKAQKKGDAGTMLLKMLETRLDNVIYKLGLAVSRGQARQMVSHALFLVNGKKVNIPSFQVKTGDIIEIKKNKKQKKIFTDLEKKIKNTELPSWLNFDLSEGKAKVLHEPKDNDVDQSIDRQAIVEFYSK